MDANKHGIEAMWVSRENEPQINAPSRASGGRIHVCPQAYVSMHSGGHDADERRFNESVSMEKVAWD